MKKKLKKPSIRTVNHRDGGMSFYADGGETLDGFKKRLMNRYPGMQGVYGSEGQNLNIIKDPNYAASDYGYGNIEFIQPGDGVVNYSDDYQYQSPTPDKYTSVYNPKGANRGDVFLDMMHGMRNDPEYMKLLQVFDQNVKNARGNDMQYFYEQEANNGYADGQDQWNNNYIDGQLRAQLAPGTIGMFSKGRKDYRQERKYDTPEMEQAAQDIRSYLKGKYASGGELTMYATERQVGSMLYPAPSLGFQNAVQEYLTMTPGKNVLNVQQPSKNKPPVYSGLGPTKRVAISNSDNTRVQTPVKDLTYDQFKSSQDAVKVREQQGKEELARRYALRKAGINDLKSGKLTDNVFNAIQELPHLFSDNPFNQFDDINPAYLVTNSVGSLGKRALNPYDRVLKDPLGTAFDVADVMGLKGAGKMLNPYLKNAAKNISNKPIYSKVFKSKNNTTLINPEDELQIIKGNVLKSDLPKNYILDSDINKLFNREKEWLQSDEFVRRKAAATGKSEAKIKSEVDRIIKNSKNANVFTKSLPKKTYGLYSGKDIAISNKLDREEALATLGHEGKHLFSEAIDINSAFKNPYRKYPTVKVGNLKTNIKEFGFNNYLRLPAEQQVRARTALDFIEQKYGIPRGTKLSTEDISKFTDDIGRYGPYRGEFINKHRDVHNLLQKMEEADHKFKIKPSNLLNKKSPFVFEKQGNFNNTLKGFLNNAWMTAPIAIGANSYFQEMGGGIELSNRRFEEGGEYELSNEEIQDLKRQGYDIELL